MVKSSFNYRINFCAWLGLFLYPTLYDFWGGVGASQRVMHVLFLMFFISAIILRSVCLSRCSYKIADTSDVSDLIRDRMVTVSFGLLIYTIGTVCYYVAVTIANTKVLDYGDMADFTRPIIYLMYILFPFVFPMDSESLKRLLIAIVSLFFVSVIFSALVYFPVAHGLVDLYKGRQSDDAVIMHFYRWSGTFGYPSDYSFLVSFFLYFYTFIYAWRRPNLSRTTTSSFAFDWPLTCLLVCFVALLLTVSRGGIAAVFVMLFLAYVFTDIKRSIKINFVLALCVSTFLSAAFFLYAQGGLVVGNMDFGYLISMVSGDGGVKLDGSANHRLREWSIAVRYFWEYFPFGSGANRLEIKELIDPLESFYGYYFIKWGFLGYIFHLSFVVWVIYRISMALRMYKKDTVLRAFLTSSILIVASVPVVFGFSSAMSDRFKCLPFYFLIVGYGLFFSYKVESSHKILTCIQESKTV